MKAKVWHFFAVWAFLASHCALFGRDGKLQHFTFVENAGQWEENILYRSELGTGTLFLEPDRLTFDFFNSDDAAHIHDHSGEPLSIRHHAYQMVFIACNKHAKQLHEEQSEAYFNYFIGRNALNWASNVKGYEKVTYVDLYEKIDLQIYSQQGVLKYDFIVRPGGNPNDIQIEYKGLSSLALQENGDLWVETTVNRITEEKPYCYQNGEKPISSTFQLKKNKLSFSFPNGYDRSQPLVIDPTLKFSTFSGSFSDNFGNTATFDSKGFLYAGSSAFGGSYPTTLGAYQETWNGGSADIAISKFDTSGTFLIYSTYIGGTSAELPHSLFVNNNDELFVYGTSSSLDYPTTADAFQTDHAGGSQQALLGMNYANGSDIVVSRLSADGSQLLASTFIGGSGNDGLNLADPLLFNYADEARGEVIVDANNNCIIASSTTSADLPTGSDVFQTTHNGEQDGCVFKLDNNLTTLIWGSYLGGTGDDAIYSIALDSEENLLLAGGTDSQDLFITPSALFGSFQGGTADGYIYKVSKNGESILRSTYYGSPAYDQVYFIEIDRSDNAYVFGQTQAPGNTFIFNATYATPNSGQMIGKIDPSLQAWEWSTVFGTGSGTPNISPSAFLVDVCNKIYLSGWGSDIGLFSNLSTTGLEVTGDAYQATTDGDDFYLMVLEDDASALVYGSFYGGNQSDEHVDGGTSRFDKKGRIYQAVCAGCGGNSDFPIEPVDAVSPTNNSANCNLAVFKMDFEQSITIADFNVPPVTCLPDSVHFENNSIGSSSFLWDFGDGQSSTDSAPGHLYSQAGSYQVMLITENPGTCNLSDTLIQEILILSDSTFSIPEVAVCEGGFEQIGLPPFADPSVTYQWQPEAGLSDPSIPNPIATPAGDVLYTLLVSNGICTDTITQLVSIIDIALTPAADTVLCSEGDQALLFAGAAGTADLFHWSSQADFSDTLNSSLADSSVLVTPAGFSTFYINAYQGICVKTDSMQIEFASNLTAVTGEISVCAGDTIELSIENQNPTFPLTHDWSPDELIISGDGTSTILTQLLSDTLFTVISTTENGCTIPDTIAVTISPLSNFAVQASADEDSLTAGESTVLHVEPSAGFGYLWSPGENLSDPTIADPVASPPNTTTYVVTVSDGIPGGCFKQDSITIFVFDAICGPPNIFVPNAFTPDGDNRNDVVYLRGKLSDVHLAIYDRWGKKVFETNDQRLGWDGTYNGKPLDPAVFVYRVSGICIDGQKFEEKGNITLIR